MTRAELPTSDLVKIRIKGPYSHKEVKYLTDHVAGCLRELVDRGQLVNYEEVLESMGNLPDTILAPEWKKYWDYQKSIMSTATHDGDRKEIFKNIMRDALIKGIFPKDQSSIMGLTGNFSTIIQELIGTNPT